MKTPMRWSVCAGSRIFPDPRPADPRSLRRFGDARRLMGSNRPSAVRAAMRRSRYPCPSIAPRRSWPSAASSSQPLPWEPDGGRSSAITWETSTISRLTALLSATWTCTNDCFYYNRNISHTTRTPIMLPHATRASAPPTGRSRFCPFNTITRTWQAAWPSMGSPARSSA